MIGFGLYYEGEQLKNDLEELVPDKLLLHSNFQIHLIQLQLYVMIYHKMEWLNLHS